MGSRGHSKERTAWYWSMTSAAFGSRGNSRQACVCFTVTDSVTAGAHCDQHTIGLSKHPGSCSTPSFLLHILVSLELCYTWDKSPVKWFHPSSTCTLRTSSSCGWTQGLPLKVWVGERTKPLCRLCIDFGNQSVVAALFGLVCCVHLSLDTVSFLSLNLHQ